MNKTRQSRKEKQAAEVLKLLNRYIKTHDPKDYNAYAQTSLKYERQAKLRKYRAALRLHAKQEYALRNQIIANNEPEYLTSKQWVKDCRTRDKHEEQIIKYGRLITALKKRGAKK